MIHHTRIMFYVDDVKRVTDFWLENFNGELVSESPLEGEQKNIVLQLQEGLELSFFPKAFIRKHSPEVLEHFPSLMLFSANFEEIHNNLPSAGEIVNINGQRIFNFSDPEGNYFALSEIA